MLKLLCTIPLEFGQVMGPYTLYITNWNGQIEKVCWCLKFVQMIDMIEINFWAKHGQKYLSVYLFYLFLHLSCEGNYH